MAYNGATAELAVPQNRRTKTCQPRRRPPGITGVTKATNRTTVSSVPFPSQVIVVDGAVDESGPLRLIPMPMRQGMHLPDIEYL